MRIREIEEGDLFPLLKLYTHLNDNNMPAMSDALAGIWEEIITDKRMHILVGEERGKIISSCVLIIVPNLTHEQRPYALVENVVTHKAYRGKGHATAILGRAREIAKEQNCYKIMLMTGQKKESTLAFYERAGYSRETKTAFHQSI